MCIYTKSALYSIWFTGQIVVYRKFSIYMSTTKLIKCLSSWYIADSHQLRLKYRRLCDTKWFDNFFLSQSYSWRRQKLFKIVSNIWMAKIQFQLLRKNVDEYHPRYHATKSAISLLLEFHFASSSLTWICHLKSISNFVITNHFRQIKITSAPTIRIQ